MIVWFIPGWIEAAHWTDIEEKMMMELIESHLDTVKESIIRAKKENEPVEVDLGVGPYADHYFSFIKYVGKGKGAQDFLHLTNIVPVTGISIQLFRKPEQTKGPVQVARLYDVDTKAKGYNELESIDNEKLKTEIVDKMLSATSSLRNRALIEVLRSTGITIDEVTKLRVRDVPGLVKALQERGSG